MSSSMPLHIWREQVGRHIIHLDFEPFGDAPFSATIDPVFASRGVRVTHASTSPGTTFRDKSLVKLDAPSLDLVIARRPLELVQGERTLTLQAGEAAFLRSWETGASQSSSRSSYSVVVMPLEACARTTSGELRRSGVIRRAEPALQLLRSHCRVLENKLYRRLSPDLQEVARRCVVDLIGLLHQERERDAAALSVREVRQAAAIAFIEANFRHPGLSSADVAASLGISVRYVNRLLEMTGRSLSARLLECRLEAARQAIETRPDARISEIALQCGFVDISAFNRCFRTRFGAPPRTFR